MKATTVFTDEGMLRLGEGREEGRLGGERGGGIWEMAEIFRVCPYDICCIIRRS